MKIFSSKSLLALISLCLICFLAIHAEDQPEKSKKTIDQAINQGVDWLKSKQVKKGQNKGSWGPVGKNQPYEGGGKQHHLKIGITALALYALLACDVPPENQVIKDGFAFIEKNLMEKSPMQTITYEQAVVLLALEALADARAKKRCEVRRILFLKPNEKKLSEKLIALLKKSQTSVGGWRYGKNIPSPHGIDEDISATQIVLLGLKSASRLGLKINKTVFLMALKYNLNQQKTNGPIVRRVIGADKEGTQMFREDMARGWAYINPGMYGSNKRLPPRETKATGGMTTAGICSLIICQSELNKQREFTKELRASTERGINDGLAWLETHYTVAQNPVGEKGNPRSHYYYLYGLERVGMLGNIKIIGTHNWYIDGAKLLLQQQREDGSWDSNTEIRPGDIFDTPFALLFLKKATKPILSD